MAVAHFNTKNTIAINQSDIIELTQRAADTPQGHYRFCLHHDNEALIQEMVIAITNRALFPPHKHPLGKSESIHIISGELATFIFNEDGNVIDIIRLSCSINNAKLQRIEGNTWHLPICLSETVVYHETLVGPYNKSNDVFIPSWAADLNNHQSLNTFYDNLKLLL